MLFKLLLPVIVGLSIVLQGTLNRSSTLNLGLASVVLLNASIFFILAVIFWLLTNLNAFSDGSFPAINLSHLQWWQFLPGLFGFLIVFCTPIAIGYLGANTTFAIIICTQLFVSMLWDSFLQKHGPGNLSIIGVVIMIVGVLTLIAGKKV